MYRACAVTWKVSKILVGIGCVATLLLGQALIASAQGQPGEIYEPGKLGELERAVEKAVQKHLPTKTLGISLYGYVDVSYTYNFNHPSTSPGTNSLRIFDVDSNAFRVNMAQIVLEKQGKSGGELLDRAGFRVKLNFGEDSQFTGGSDVGDETDFQEVYVQYVAPFGSGLDLRMGRQNTLIGFEVIESPYNPNFSRSWLFGLGEPFTTTGARAAYAFNDNVSLAIGAISSFTQATGDTNEDLSLESALSLTLHERLGVTGFLFWGNEQARNTAGAGDVILSGGIVTLGVTDQTSAVVEAYYANQANASTISPARNSRWNGVAAYLIHDFTDQWGIRVRGEIFEDAGGARACLQTSTTPAAPRAGVCAASVSAPIAQTLWETTFTLQYKPVPPLITRVEFRYDKSNKNTFQDGANAANNQQTLALEAIYLF